MTRPAIRLLVALLAVGSIGALAQPPAVDLLITGGRVLDGAGNPWMPYDIGIRGDTIVFVGHAAAAGVTARETLEADGRLVTPGFWDVHSHASLESPDGRMAKPQLYQGITTVLLGVDGAGTDEVGEVFESYRKNGIAVNAMHYVGQGAARRVAMGSVDREPTPAELEAMKQFIARGMEQGAVGMSTGLFYAPGFFAKTAEVIELNKVAARYGGIYDTHDRDLGAAYKSIGYDASVKEAIEIAEKAGTALIFSHFGPQGAKNYGRAAAGITLVEEARARGINVMAGQHTYDATNSNLSAYVIPRWAVEGGNAAMRERFKERKTWERLMKEITEMVAIRGGADKIVFSDQDPDLNGKTLQDKARDWKLSVPEAAMRILTEHDGGVGVMNRQLYDVNNARLLAQQDWMMTCTDGGTPVFGRGIVHPRSYGAFTKKLREYVYQEKAISLPFAIRGMTGLAASFFGVQDRGFIRQGQKADIVVLDEARIRDLATYENPHRYSEGTVHVIVNGKFAFRDGAPTGTLAGLPIPRSGTRAAGATAANP